MFEVNDNQSKNYEMEIHDLHMNWSIPNEPNAKLTDLHFQIWLSSNPISKSAQDVYEIVNVSSLVGKVRMSYTCVHVQPYYILMLALVLHVCIQWD